MNISDSPEVLREIEGVAIPEPISPRNLDIASISHLVDDYGKEHAIYALTPHSEMPVSVAEWVRYRTFTEGRKLREGDQNRFRSVEHIRDNFLSGQNGRTFFFGVGVETGYLNAVSWFHSLSRYESDNPNDDPTMHDPDLVDAGLLYLRGFGYKNPPVRLMSTFATCEYGYSAYKGLEQKLGAFSVERFFEEFDRECLVVVGRYRKNDNFQTEILDAQNADELKSKFRVIQGIGENLGKTVIIGAVNPVFIELPEY